MFSTAVINVMQLGLATASQKNVQLKKLIKKSQSALNLALTSQGSSFAPAAEILLGILFLVVFLFLLGESLVTKATEKRYIFLKNDKKYFVRKYTWYPELPPPPLQPLPWASHRCWKVKPPQQQPPPPLLLLLLLLPRLLS